MLKFFYVDMKRILFRLKNILLMAAIAAMFTYSDSEANDFEISSWLVFITMNVSLISAALAAASCSSSDSFCDDMEYNYTRQIILRTGCFGYSIIRVFTSFFTSSLVFMGGYALSAIVRVCRYGMPSAEQLFYAKDIGIKSMYGKTFINHGLLWYGICIGMHIAVLAGVLALWGLLLSLYMNNRMLAYLMPVAALNILDMLIQRVFGVAHGAAFSLYAIGISGLSFPKDNMSPMRYYSMILINIIVVAVLVYKTTEKKVRVIG